MDQYATYIWASYAIAAVILLWCGLSSLRLYRQARRLEAQGDKTS